MKNPLVLSSFTSAPFWKPEPKPRVTLIVGIIAKDAVVLSADSQTSYGSLKIPDAEKIHVVKFKHGREVLVAGAGAVSLSNQAVEFISEMAGEIEVDSKWAVSEVVQKAMYKVRVHQINIYPKRRYTLIDWKKYFLETSPMVLTVAYYAKNEPVLFTIFIHECIANFCDGYSAVGVGDYLGSYLLKELYRPSMDKNLATTVAIKIAKDAATYVEGCGLPIKVATVQPRQRTAASLLSTIGVPGYTGKMNDYTPEITIFTPEKIKELMRIIEKVEKKSSQSKTENMHREFKSAAKKSYAKMMKGFGLKP
jgi:20S proteasome alpha/beta subunit